MGKLCNFADYVWVLKRMNDYKVQPVVLTSKKGINQYRQRAEAYTKKSAQFVSMDFDLIWFPFGKDLPEEERHGFTSESDLLKWLMGSYSKPSRSQYKKEIAFAKDVPYTPLPGWLKDMGIDLSEKRNVNMQLLVTQLEPTLIPDTVKEAHDIGIDVRKYIKNGSKQPRGCIIDGRGKNPCVYHIFKDFRPGEIEPREIIPGFPQIANSEGKMWWGLASDDSKYIRFYSDTYEEEFGDSPTYEEVLSERDKIEGDFNKVRDVREACKDLKILDRV